MAKCANLSGLILRAFYTRDYITMLTMFTGIPYYVFFVFLFNMQLSHIYYITILQIKCFTYKKTFFTLAGPGGAKRRLCGVILNFE